MKTHKLIGKVSRKLFVIKKASLQQFTASSKKKRLLFIVGCQRSGTSLVYRIFENDLNTKVFGEHSRLSSIDDQKIRLNPLHMVQEDIKGVKASFVVLKPLVESQNTLRLLEYFPDSKALWIYRNYKDVALSNLKRFGIQNGINNLKPIVENDKENWRSENVPDHIRALILEHYSENMNPYDAAVLFWYVRNNFYFELGLDRNSDILLSKYEDITSQSERVFRSIYKQVAQPYPGSNILEEIHAKSVKKGKNISLSPEVEQLANNMLDKLNKAYQEKNLNL